MCVCVCMCGMYTPFSARHSVQHPDGKKCPIKISLITVPTVLFSSRVSFLTVQRLIYRGQEISFVTRISEWYMNDNRICTLRRAYFLDDSHYSSSLAIFHLLQKRFVYNRTFLQKFPSSPSPLSNIARTLLYLLCIRRELVK